MSSKRTDPSGFNARYNSNRFAGFDGAHGANIFPFEDEVPPLTVSGGGTTDSEVIVPSGSIVYEVQINVTQVFGSEGEGATITVGREGDADALVTLADNIDLATTGIKFVNRETAWPTASEVRVTIGGEAIGGNAIITVSYSV